MSVVTQLTQQEFLNLPDKPGKQELLDGELIEVPPAKRTPSKIIRRVQRWLEAVIDESRVWVETGYQIRPESRWLQPDVSVSWPDQQTWNDWFQGVPPSWPLRLLRRVTTRPRSTKKSWHTSMEARRRFGLSILGLRA